MRDQNFPHAQAGSYGQRPSPRASRPSCARRNRLLQLCVWCLRARANLPSGLWCGQPAGSCRFTGTPTAECTNRTHDNSISEPSQCSGAHGIEHANACMCAHSHACMAHVMRNDHHAEKSFQTLPSCSLSSVIFFPTPVTSATTIRANWLSSARCWVTCTLCVRASFATLTSARSMSLSRFLSDFLMLLMFLTWIYLLVHLGTYRRIFVRLFAYVCAYKNIPTYTYTRIRMLLSWSCLYLCHLTYMYTYIHSYMPQIFVLSLFWILRGQNWNWNTSAHSKNVQM